MRRSALVTRTIAATSALALSVVGFVALPGTAQASVTPVAPTVTVGVNWTNGDPYAQISWSGAVTRTTLTGYDIIFGVGDSAFAVETWDDVVCTEGTLGASATTCHATQVLAPSSDYSFGVGPLDAALSGIRGYGSVHVPASDPNAQPDPTPSDPTPSDPEPSDPPATVAPAAPTVITDIPDATSLALSWSGAVGGDAGLDHYVVAWYADGGPVGTDVTAAETYTVTGLTTGQLYEVRVWTVDGLGSLSADYAAVTDAPAAPADPGPAPDPGPTPADPVVGPGYPDGFSVEQRSTTSITWRWGTAAQGTYPVDHYVVTCTAQGSEDAATVVTTDGLTGTVDGLLPGTAYDCSAETVDDHGNGSGVVSASTSTVALADVAPVDDTLIAYAEGTWTVDALANDLGVPTTATVVDEPMHGHASWTGTGFQYVVDDTQATADSFTYRNELSDQVATVSVTIQQVVAPSTPQITEQQANGQTSITVAWTASDAGTFPIWRYIVTWKSSTGTWQYVLTPETSVTLDGLEPGTEHIVDVVAEDTWTNVSDSVRATVTTDAVPAPTAPSGLGARSAGRYAVDLAWDAAEPGTVSSYRISHRLTGSGSAWTEAPDETGAATGSHVTGLEPAATYDVRVVACDAAERCSDAATTVASTEVVAPGAPELTAEAVGTGSVALSWTGSTGGNGEIDGYEVFYRAAGTLEWIHHDYLDVEDRAATIGGLDAATTYEFKVIAWDVDEFGSPDALASATTDEALTPAPLRPRITTSGAIVSGSTARFGVTDVSGSATVEAGDLVDGVSAVQVDGLDVQLVTVAGFSGTISQPLLVADGGDLAEITADVLVNPAAASGATYRIVSPTASRVLWTAGSGATGYVVKVGSATVCSTSVSTCLVPRLLGPADIVTISAGGHDGTVSVAARATWVGVPVGFGHVHFVGDSPRLTTASTVALRALTARLMAAGITRVTVHGYTATQGSATRTPVQMRLSAMRAHAVAAYLTAYYAAHGRTLRVMRVAEGATHPIASNATASGRAENRRAEVVLG